MVGSHALVIEVKEQQEAGDSFQIDEAVDIENEGCRNDGEPDENIKKQWVARVLDFSSEYNSVFLVILFSSIFFFLFDSTM